MTGKNKNTMSSEVAEGLGCLLVCLGLAILIIVLAWAAKYLGIILK